MLKNWIYTFIVVTLGIVSHTLHAQQQGQYSQYMMNYFLINPAVAGTDDNLDARAGYRVQWLGLAGSPRNYYASVHAPINKVHAKSKRRKKADAYHVAGGFFSGQKLGALTHNTAYATYAYHLPLSSKWIMSMGAIAGMNQFSVDQSSLDLGDNVSDLSVLGKNQTKFDLGMGIWLYSPKTFIGLSSMQLLQGKVDFSQTIPGSGILNRHFYLTGGHNFYLDKHLKLIPSVLIKQTASSFQVDVNTKVRYKDFLWGGISYRKADAIVLLAGVGIPLSNSKSGSGVRGNGHGNNTRLEIGYSYDATTSKLRAHSGGSHEIMLGLVLPLQNGKVINPSDYW